MMMMKVMMIMMTITMMVMIIMSDDNVYAGFNLVTWKRHLDSLQLSVNSSTISQMQLIPPLGYFNTKLKLLKSSS